MTGDADAGFTPHKSAFQLSAKTQRRLVIGVFLVVPIGSLIVFNIYPLIQLVYYSLTNFNGVNLARAKFVGLLNYQDIFTRDSELIAPIVNSFYYLFGSMVQILLATWFAVILNMRLPGSRLFRTILFIPFVLNAVAAALVFRHLLQLDGTLNEFLSTILGQNIRIPWIDSRNETTNFSLAAASVWRYLGFNLVITFPSIRNVLFLQLALSVVGSLEVFEIPQLITGGAGKTSTFAIQMVQTGFQFRRAGTAAAMAVFMLVIVLALYLITQLVARRMNRRIVETANG